jgi:hypothetical protein
MLATPTAITERSALRELVTWTATIPLWQRDALRRLYAECPLSDDAEATLFAHLKTQHGLAKPDETADAPISLPAHHCDRSRTTCSRQS